MGLRTGYSMSAVHRLQMRDSVLLVGPCLDWDSSEAVRVFQSFPRRVQEQESQKRQLCEELEQLKAPQDSREASCQTPASEEEVGDGRPRASCRTPSLSGCV